ncbi:MAG: hypothetical protein AAFY16_08325 [Cyanobacteria bacterium J06642_3]
MTPAWQQEIFLTMADLTLAQRFGDDVSFNESTGVLSINLNNLSSITVSGVDVGLDISSMTEANQDQYASRIIWGLLQLQLQNQPENNNDETVGIYVTNQGKRNERRNSVAQLGFNLTTTAYINDTQGVILDPDAIGA